MTCTIMTTIKANSRLDSLVYDENTPVVVAEMNHSQAGEIFGVSKVKGGNRMGTTYLSSMCIVFYPAKKRARAWVTV